MIFQIAGLPRSGTAWISSVLNLCPNIMCVHEPIDQNVHVPESSYKNSGQAGSHLVIPSLRDMTADLRVFIDRNASDAYDSLCDAIGDFDPDTFENVIHYPSKSYIELADIVIDYDNLFTEDAVRFVWEAITNDPFNRDKVLSMLNMNIQRYSLEYDFEDEFLKKCIKEFNKNEE